MPTRAYGTARRADGSTGDNAVSAAYNGQRAAFYANSGVASGLGYSPYEPGNDLATGQIHRPGNNSGPQKRYSGAGEGNQYYLDPQQMLLDRGLNYGMGLANSAT